MKGDAPGRSAVRGSCFPENDGPNDESVEEALQIRAKFACGATRLQEEGFVKILCDEGAN